MSVLLEQRTARSLFFTPVLSFALLTIGCDGNPATSVPDGGHLDGGSAESVGADDAGAATPLTIAAVSKGPNQITLTWSAVSQPGYGYAVEVKSGGDSRYSAFTVLSGPSSPHHKRIPTWVTEPH